VADSRRESPRSRAGELLIPLLDEAGGRAEVDALLADRQYVDALRRVRQLTGLSFADAKMLVDTLARKSGRRLVPPGGLPPEWIGHHRAWRLWLAPILPSLGVVITWLIPALRGGRAIIDGICLLVLLACYVELAIFFRRERKAARDRAQGRG
jgi:hypothetical protein